MAVRDSKYVDWVIVQLTPTTWAAFTAHVGAL
ncbi:DUF397 domain-containing protein [Streptomyces sp. Agncl-13]